MNYAGTIAVDLTGGDTFEGKTIFERTTRWTREAAIDFPNIQFYVSGSGENIHDVYFPGNVKRISHTPDENSLEEIIFSADKLEIDGIVTHEKARKLQMSLLGDTKKSNELQTTTEPKGLQVVCGLRRPALIAILPTKFKRKYVIALDVGANHWSKPVDLEQYAYLGAIVSKYLFQTSEPKVSLFNMCEESNFGPQEYQELHAKLSNAKNLNFIGFTESRHILGLISHGYLAEENKLPDVVVFEGFCGNEFIKTIQDSMKLLKEITVQEMFYSPIPVVSQVINYLRAGITLGLNAMPTHRILKRLHPKRYGGALLAGVRTAKGRDLVFIKGHGEADRGIYYGIKRAIEYHQQGIIRDINQELEETLMTTDTVKSSDRQRFEELQKEKIYAKRNNSNAPNQI